MSHPTISSFRQPPLKKTLVSSAPLPEPAEVFLKGNRNEDGTFIVTEVSMTKPTTAQPDDRADAGALDDLSISYPSKSKKRIRLHHTQGDWRTPGMHALLTLCVKAAKKPSDWMLSETTEAVFVDMWNYVPAVDLRASLISGPNGPAPLPKNTSWPKCPHCRKRFLYSQSVDFRDVAFAERLPGTTAVIFFCTECHEDGDWETCSTAIWLAHDSPIELHSAKKNSTLLRQCRQYYGPDGKAPYRIAPKLLNQLEALQEKEVYPLLYMHASYGTKAGGNPFYLQSDPQVFDRDGGAMEYIGQIATPDHMPAGGFGYIFYSVKTGETQVVFQNT